MWVCENPSWLYHTPTLKWLNQQVFMLKETVSTLHTMVPRQTSQCGWQLIILGPFLDKHQHCGYNNLFQYIIEP